MRRLSNLGAWLRRWRSRALHNGRIDLVHQAGGRSKRTEFVFRRRLVSRAICGRDRLWACGICHLDAAWAKVQLRSRHCQEFGHAVNLGFVEACEPNPEGADRSVLLEETA